jgi:hypothetical protein
MSTEQQNAESDASSKENIEPETDEHHNVIEKREPAPNTEMPEVTDEHKAQANEVYEKSVEDRETIKMPGTDGAVAGTAVNDWVDDNGNPKFSDKKDG